MIIIDKKFKTNFFDLDKQQNIFMGEVAYEDPLEAFWDILYNTEGSYSYWLEKEREWIKWLFVNQIPFTLKIDVVDIIDNYPNVYWYDEVISFGIVFQNPKDEMFFKLKFL